MTEKSQQSNDTPPSGLSLEQQANWWREHGANMENVKTLSNHERICPRCGAPQPCTGTDECTACSGSLAGAKRKKLNLFQPQ